MQRIPTITSEEVARFARTWTHNGVAIVIDDLHAEFTRDFANIVLKSFVQMCAQQAAEAMKPKVVLAED
jgi:hypothetical protein